MNAVENVKRIAGAALVNGVPSYLSKGEVERRIDDMFSAAIKLAWRPGDKEPLLQLKKRFEDPDCAQKAPFESAVCRPQLSQKGCYKLHCQRHDRGA